MNRDQVFLRARGALLTDWVRWWRTGDDPGVRLRAPEHPAWHHLTERSVRRHYHGLLHPPQGATVLARTEKEGPGPREVLLYGDRVSTPGRLVVTTMDPVHHHGSAFMPGATQLLHGLPRWTGTGSGRG
ncbi:hypothetical protein ACIP88_23005 [Streptomyces uncialis]|uniref:hypothetical protein n=1 Tax=Streptomyces uncialis TaxID=1048205 RepID=UPI0037FB024D